MMMTSWRKLMALLAALALVAAACGSDGETSAEADDDASATTAAANSAEADDDASATTAAENSSDRPSDWPDSVVFGAVPAEASSSLEADFETTRAILMSELGIDIEFFQASDYAGVIEGIIAKRVDVAQFGGFSYVIATINGADVSVAGVMTDGPDIEPGYRSYAITRPGSGITSMEDFAGKNICFVDPGSTSGFLFPSEGLLAVGLDPSETSTDINPTFAGGHDASALTVASGDCDAGFAYDSMVTAQLIESGDIAGVIDTAEGTETVNEAEAELEIIWKSQVIAGAPMVINNSLPASFVKAFQEVVTTKVNLGWALANGFCEGTPEDNTCSFADEEDTWGFAAKDDSFYDGIRRVCEITQSTKCS
ncbi:MAG: phosphate/phosphite/phosphonate ABC transporter substrate-binding protein [Actinomycetota bacterium]|nr:phosphate/phosphite/phosphonate ABC transporter substrate-binding protein [Actinomycetota bacterium]